MKSNIIFRTCAIGFFITSFFCSVVTADDNASPCPNQIYALKSTIWKTIQIPVCWESMNKGFLTEQEWVRQAIENSWEKNSSLRFTGWGVCQNNDQGIRIGIGDINPHTKGLGNEINGVRQGMVLDFTFREWSPVCSSPNRRESCIRTIAVHEFGHALGFAHEQNRSDAPLWCQAEKQAANGDIFTTPYDLESVMNYCNPKWNGAGELSQLDIQGLQVWYGKPNKPFNRFDGRWIGKLTYSDQECVADTVELNVNGTSLVGEMRTPDGRRVRVNSSIDESGNLTNFRLRLSDKDLIVLRGALTDGVTRSSDCGCGSYAFKRVN